MKKFLIAAIATTMLASPFAATAAEAAPQRERHTTVVRQHGNHTTVVRRDTYRQPTYRNWRRGERFESRYARNYRTVDYRNYRGRHLYAPPRGYHWVRSGNDAVLVAVAGGLIGAVISGAFN